MNSDQILLSKFITKGTDAVTRIAKEPEERKAEIIDAAQKLFEEKGYENTMMSDVAQSVGISQGLPYRYFKSKLELLDAVAVKLGEEFLKKVVGFKFKPGMNAKDKLDVYFDMFVEVGSSKLVSLLHKKNNSQIHKRMSENIFKSLIPELQKLIDEGNDEKCFDCPDPDESAQFLIYGAMSVHDMISEANDLTEKMQIIKTLFYRVLSVKRN